VALAFPSFLINDFFNQAILIKKILIIRFSSIGDIVLTSPVIRAVKNQTNAKLHFLVKERFASVMKFNPFIDTHWNFDPEDDSLITNLKAENFDLVLDLQKNWRSKKLVKALGVKSIKFDKDNIRKWAYVNFKFPALPNRHIVDRYFSALEEIGIKNDGLGLDFHLHPVVNTKAQYIIEKYICISIGAAHNTKQIPEDTLAQICDQIDTKIFLLGGKVDEEKGKRIAATREHVINKAGMTSLQESAGILKKAKVLLAADTGLMHMAVGLKVPTLVMWGSTVPELGMYPYYGSKNVTTFNHEVKDLSCRPCSKLGKESCPKGHFNCMKKQNVSAIVDQIKTLVED